MLFSLLLTILAAEWILRRMSAHQPWANWEYKTSPQGTRGPFVSGPKRPGITRILVQGDSITYGAGVSDYKELYPYRLLAKLNAQGEKYEMFSIGVPGREVNGQARELDKLADTLCPDMIVYQWFVNDVELSKVNRPESRITVWRKLSFHEQLKRRSYLYALLDERLPGILPRFNRSYEQYLLEDFAEKSRTGFWYMFRFEFHTWATRASLTARRNILMLYPLLPFRGEYPLRTLHERMREISGRSVFAMPAYMMHMKDGTNVTDRTSTYGICRKALRDRTLPNTYLVHGPYLLLGAGAHQVAFRMKADALHSGLVAKLDVVCDDGRTVLAQTTLSDRDFAGAGQWQKFTLPFSVPRKFVCDLEFRVQYLGQADLSVDCVQLPTQYNIEVLDLTPYLKDMNTWASPADGHPNAATHQVMADRLYRQITEKNGGRLDKAPDCDNIPTNSNTTGAK
ncbi:MAG: SGNH/GDSL hydrolase family protein [Kiritimatiellaeota bacterium]|nr:SGNH/GDSL hydrolase family protein [Kiritimatiellota bacterium]